MRDNILTAEGECAGHADETLTGIVRRLLKRGSISVTAEISVVLFVGLNIGDAWLTKQLLAIGCQEANPLVSGYGANMVIKGFLALAIVLGLGWSGKAKLLWILNICMVAVVLWNTGWLLYSS